MRNAFIPQEVDSLGGSLLQLIKAAIAIDLAHSFSLRYLRNEESRLPSHNSPAAPVLPACLFVLFLS